MNKKEKLETLLNSLIARGRSPRNKEKVALISIVGEQLRLLEADWSIYTPYSPRLRELVSLESWLWQFVCDEQLHKQDQRTDSDWVKNIEDTRDSEKSIAKYLTEADYRYRLLESALVPEEELAQFLLDNIIITWNSKYEIR